MTDARMPMDVPDSDGAPTEKQERTLGIAMSGGGVRAALFSLGAILYLWKSGLHKQVRLITSVSGGSITNAVLAASGDLTAAGSSEDSDFFATAQRFARALASHGSFFFPGWRRLALGILALFMYPVLMSGFIWWSGDRPTWGVFAILSLGYVVPMTLITLTYMVVGRKKTQRTTYARLLASALSAETGIVKKAFHRQRRLQLSELPESRVTHVICATELNSGRPIYMSARFTYSPAYGWGESRIPVSSAMYASAGFPGAFPPLQVRTEPLMFSGGDVAGDRPRHLLLADGGVFNNLGTDWFDQASRASKTLFGTDRRFTLPPAVDTQIVINASSPPRVARLPRRWPQRNLVAFVRIITVLYENTVRPRMEALMDAPEGDSVLVLEISESPLDLARRIRSECSDDDTRARASRVVDSLEEVPAQYWGEFAGKASLTKTTLAAIGSDASARLIRHGFLTAAVACHARFGTGGLTDVPDERWFFNLVEEPRDTPES